MKIAPDLQKFHNKMVQEAIIKSSLLGFATGFSLTLILATIFYFIRFDGILLGAIIGIAVGVIASLLYYFYLFFPTIKKTAARLDQMGLDERMITMLEFENEETFIAQKQREDTTMKVSKIPPKSFKFISFAKYIVILALTAISSVSMSVVLAFEVSPKYYTIHWKVDQEITETSVLENTMPSKEAPTKEGFVFSRWEPEVVIVTKDATYTAVFVLDGLSEEDQIIAQLIESLRNLVDNADVSETLKTDLHGLIDELVESLKPEDTLLIKIAKIEATRAEIIARIQAEINTIAEELQSRDTTVQLGDVVALNNKFILKDFIDEFVLDFEAMPAGQEKIDLLLLTADEIELALEESNEYNPGLRVTLQALADLLRRMAINTIAEELQSRDTTKTLGDAVAARDQELLNQFIQEFIQKFIDMPMNEDKIQLLTDTADDIEAALEESNEDNEPLREQLQALADLLRSMIPKIEGDIPDDQAQEELEEQMQEIIDAIGEILNPQPQDQEGQLQDEIDEAIQDAIDELNGTDPSEEPVDPEDPEDPTEGDSEEGEEGSGNPNDGENPKVIDGQTDYIDELINLKADLIARLNDPNLTDSERATINKYIENIDSLIDEAS